MNFSCISDQRERKKRQGSKALRFSATYGKQQVACAQMCGQQRMRSRVHIG